MTEEQFQSFRKGNGVIQLSFEQLDAIIVSAYNLDPDDFIKSRLSGELFEIELIGEKTNQRQFVNIDTSQNVTMPGKP